MSSSNHKCNIPYYVRALAMGLPAMMFGMQISILIGLIPAVRNGHADFRNLYVAGWMLRSGYAHQLYDYRSQKDFQDSLVSREEVALPFIRPAYQALLFAPFSYLRFRTAYFCFLLFNLGLLGLCFCLMRPRMRWLKCLHPAAPLAIFSFPPLAVALFQGQDSILLLTLLCIAVVALDKHKPKSAGMLVGLGLFKFQIVIPIAVVFMIRRKWKFLLGFVLSASVLSIASVLIVGPRVSTFYVRSLISIGTSKGLDSGVTLPVSYMANLHGLIFGLCGTRIPPNLSLCAIVMLSAIVLLLSAKYRALDGDALAFAIITSVLVSYYMFIHDLSPLLIPLAFLRGSLKSMALVFIAPVLMAFAPSLFFLASLPILGWWLCQRNSSVDRIVDPSNLGSGSV
jgi:Glycosyltransferase family 87